MNSCFRLSLFLAEIEWLLAFSFRLSDFFNNSTFWLILTHIHYSVVEENSHVQRQFSINSYKEQKIHVFILVFIFCLFAEFSFSHFWYFFLYIRYIPKKFWASSPNTTAGRRDPNSDCNKNSHINEQSKIVRIPKNQK